MGLAIGFIMGTVIGRVVTALVQDLIMPIPGAFIAGGDWRKDYHHHTNRKWDEFWNRRFCRRHHRFLHHFHGNLHNSKIRTKGGLEIAPIYFFSLHTTLTN